MQDAHRSISFTRRGLDRPKHILLVCGARPNFIKIAPLYHALVRAGTFFRPTILHTGQHYDHRLSGVFFEELGIPAPEVNLGIGSGSHAEQTAKAMVGIERYLIEARPDLVVCVGDVNSTLAASLAASKCGAPCAHLEAGLRSGDRAMPEEINRIVADHTSDWLYTTCRDGNENLLREGIDPRRIIFAGNLMIDTLLSHGSEIEASDAPERLGLRRRGYVLITIHRSGNLEDVSRRARLADIIRRTCDLYTVVFPVHPRTRRCFQELTSIGAGEGQPLGSRLRLLEPLGYVDFLALQRHAHAVLTDSGGIQEETTVLGVPCLTLRENTERPITIREGTNTLAGLDPDRVIAALMNAGINRMAAPYRPELWDGQTASRIVRHLSDVVFAKPGRVSSHRTPPALLDIEMAHEPMAILR